MKILIANPGLRIDLEGDQEKYFFGAGCRFSWSLRKKVAQPPRYSMFPFFLGYTAAVLERDGFAVQVIDGVPLNLSYADFLRHAVATKPDVVLFEPSTPSINYASRLSRDLARETGARIIFAGPHVTSLPRGVLAEHPHVEAVLIGEYELTFLELARRMQRGQDFAGLDGVAYRDSAGAFRGGSRSREIDPVDQLPAPARHLFPAYFNQDIGLYHDGFCQHRPAVQLHSSRGCPFRCSFCLWIQVLYNGGKHRCFSPERVVDEMIQVQNRYGAREIYFDDDDFTVVKDHVLGVCDEIERRGLRIPWSVMGDAMATDEETLARMGRAGCIGMKFGLESADPTVLKRIGKPIKLDRVRMVVNAARKAGIKTHMTVTFGLPGETRQSLQRTFDFACELDIDSVQFSVATPFPGTRLYEELKASGRLQFNTWEDYDGANNSVCAGEDFGPEYLEEFEADAHGRWLRHKLRDPEWLRRQIRQLIRLGKGQGVRGLTRRFSRGFKMLVEHRHRRVPSGLTVDATGARLRATGTRP